MLCSCVSCFCSLMIHFLLLVFELEHLLFWFLVWLWYVSLMNCMGTCSLNSVASFLFVVCWVQALQMGVPEHGKGCMRFSALNLLIKNLSLVVPRLQLEQSLIFFLMSLCGAYHYHTFASLSGILPPNCRNWLRHRIKGHSLSTHMSTEIAPTSLTLSMPSIKLATGLSSETMQGTFCLSKRARELRQRPPRVSLIHLQVAWHNQISAGNFQSANNVCCFLERERGKKRKKALCVALRLN